MDPTTEQKKGVVVTLLSNANMEEYPDNTLTTFTNKLPESMLKGEIKQYAISLESINTSTHFGQDILPVDKRYPPVMCVPNVLEKYVTDMLQIYHDTTEPMSMLSHFHHNTRFYMEYKNYLTPREVRDTLKYTNRMKMRYVNMFGVDGRTGAFYMKLKGKDIRANYDTTVKYIAHRYIEMEVMKMVKMRIMAEEDARKEQERIEAEKEAKRIAAEEEAKRIAAEEEARRIAAEEEARRIAAEEEARRIAAEEEARRIAAEEEARRIAAEEEARRIAAEEEAKRIAAEEEARRIAAEEEARRIAAEKEEKKRKAKEELENRKRAKKKKVEKLLDDMLEILKKKTTQDTNVVWDKVSEVVVTMHEPVEEVTEDTDPAVEQVEDVTVQEPVEEVAEDTDPAVEQVEDVTVQEPVEEVAEDTDPAVEQVEDVTVEEPVEEEEEEERTESSVVAEDTDPAVEQGGEETDPLLKKMKHVTELLKIMTEREEERTQPSIPEDTEPRSRTRRSAIYIPQSIEQKVKEISTQLYDTLYAQLLLDVREVGGIVYPDKLLLDTYRQKHLLINTTMPKVMGRHAYRLFNAAEKAYGQYVYDVLYDVGMLQYTELIDFTGIEERYRFGNTHHTIYVYKGFLDNWLRMQDINLVDATVVYIDNVPYYKKVVSERHALMMRGENATTKAFIPSFNDTFVVQCDQIQQQLHSRGFTRNLAYFTIDAKAKVWPYRHAEAFVSQQMCPLEGNDLKKLTVRIRTLENTVPKLQPGQCTIVKLKLRETKKMDTGFYVTANSKDNVYELMQNTVADFTVKLPYPKALYGHEDWFVGLFSLIIPNRYPLPEDIHEKKIMYCRFKPENPTVPFTFSIDDFVEKLNNGSTYKVPTLFRESNDKIVGMEAVPRYVHDAKSLAYFFNTSQIASKYVKVSLVEHDTKISIKFQRFNYGIILPSKLAYFMGMSVVGVEKTEYVHIIANDVTNEYTFPVAHRFKEKNPSSIFVYSDMITESLVGGVPLQVLKIIPVPSENDSTVMTFRPDTVEYHKVNRKFLDLLHFKIRSHDGSTISVVPRDGENIINETIMTLHFIQRTLYEKK